MWLALVIASIAVVLGAISAFVPQLLRFMPSIRRVAMVAAIGVVVFQLLPSAYGQIGGLALIAFGAAFGLPFVATWIADRARPGHDTNAPHEHRHGIAFELGFSGMVVHALGDGFGIWAFGRAGSPDWPLVTALVLHIVPTTAVVVLHVAVTRGLRHAALRATVLLCATVLGVAMGGFVAQELVEAGAPWIEAIAGGLLLHVVLHDWRGPRP